MSTSVNSRIKSSKVNTSTLTNVKVAVNALVN